MDADGGEPVVHDERAEPVGETNGTPASRFGYTGQQYLPSLGLCYYKARMYSPTMGRFLQTHPIRTKVDLNLHAYVKNNPVNFTDPTGLLASLSGGNFTLNGSAPATAPKLDAPAISIPATAAGNQAAVQIATGTNNPNYAAKMLGYEWDEFGTMIQSMKAHMNLSGADNVQFIDNGDVVFRGVVIGNMHDYTK